MTSIDKAGWIGMALVLAIAAESHHIPANISLVSIALVSCPIIVWWLCAEESCTWMQEQFQHRDLLSQADVQQINAWWFAGRAMAVKLQKHSVSSFSPQDGHESLMCSR